MVTNCQYTKLVQVNTVTATSTTVTSLTLQGTGMAGTGQFVTGTSEVFPMQTLIYYVAPSANNASTLSLYRHVFNGTSNTGTQQELIEGVENMQVTYGVDNVTSNANPTIPDYTADVYQAANDVANWSNVVSVRVALLIRPVTPLAPDVTSAASAAVNGVTATFPDRRFDRRVFTTTIALRNKIPYAVAP